MIPALVAMAMIAVLIPMLAINRSALGLAQRDGITFWGNVCRAVADFSTMIITWCFFEFANEAERPLKYLDCQENLIPALAAKCNGLDYALAPISPNNHYTLFLFAITLTCDVFLIIYLARKKMGKDITLETFEMPCIPG